MDDSLLRRILDGAEYALPLIAGPDSIWFAMPITEAAVMLYAAVCIKKDTAALPERN